MGPCCVLLIVAVVVFIVGAWAVGKIAEASRVKAQARLDVLQAERVKIEEENKRLQAMQAEIEDKRRATEQQIKEKRDALATQNSRDRRAILDLAEEQNKQNDQHKQAILILAKEKCQGFPWLADAYAAFFEMEQDKLAEWLEQKKHPARRAANIIREIATARRTVEVKLRIAQGLIEYWTDLFPFLEEFLDDCDDELLRQVLSKHIDKPIQEIAEADIDPARFWAKLPEAEYNKLTSAERNQRALDNYWASRKSKWQIGRDYERFVGYLCEKEGFAVYYQGILEGYDDLGRDLIARKGDNTFVIQCKRWSVHKTIHEKHVNQLFGTTVRYCIDHPAECVTPVLYTTTVLSDRARDFAKHLKVVLREEFPIGKYPSIKCNVSRLNGERIYHLPFDQMYDRTIIEPERGECFLWTVQEAESLGFRRAWRWQGTGNEAKDT
jgi:hypothetical protein